MKKYSIYNNIFTLHTLQEERIFRLARLQDSMVYQGYFSFVKTASALRENTDTDIDMMERFTDAYYTPPVTPELHLQRCLDNSITECSCTPDRLMHDVPGGMIL